MSKPIRINKYDLNEYVEINNDSLERRRDKKRGPSWRKKMGKEKADRLRHKFSKNWTKRFGATKARIMKKKASKSWDRKYGKAKADMMRRNLKKKLGGKTKVQIQKNAQQKREKRERMRMM